MVARRLAAPLVLAISIALVAMPTTVHAQVPDSFTNLKVLPKTISRDSLLRVMRGFAGALGVRCEFCHVEVPAASPGGRPHMAFAKDSKPTKRKARFMLRMVEMLNDSVLPHLPHRGPPRVDIQCVTCHHGKHRPRTLVQVLDDAVRAGGVDSASTLYASLRKEYYGSGAYDFRPTSLAALAGTLLRDRRADDAAAVLQMSLKYDANDADTYAELGMVREAQGQKQAAIAAYRKALQLDPRNFRARERLRRLGGS